MNVTDTRVLLVGSLPFNNAEQSFRAVGQSLRGQIGWIRDGEFGERKNRVAMLPDVVFSEHPDLEETCAPLDDLEIGDARVLLGVVQHTVTIDAFRRWRDRARKHLRECAIGSVCGYGRCEPEEAQHILDLYADDKKDL